jgi:hypothetical protein
LLAREMGKCLAPMLRQVITIGTPFNLGSDPKTDRAAGGWLTRLFGEEAAVLGPELRRRLRAPPPLPTTSLYCSDDPCVDWRTCVHDLAPDGVQDIDLAHCAAGLGANAAVWQVVADRLQQMPATWQPWIACDTATPAPLRRRGVHPVTP